jgi:hypothetical protein
MITVFVIVFGASSASAGLSSSFFSEKIGRVPIFLLTESKA